MGIGSWGRRGAAGVLGAALLVVAGCAGEGGSGGAAVEPVTFDTGPKTTVADVAPEGDWPAAALHDEQVYLNRPGALVVYDATSGEETARVEPEGEPLFDSVDPTEYYRPTPALADVDGESTVLVGFAVEPSGATQLDVEIVALDAATAEVRWRVTIPEPAAAPVVPQKDASVRVLGVERGVAVMSVAHDSATQVTFGLSLAEREVLWEDDEASVVGVDSGVAAGFGSDTVAGIDVETGDHAWKSEIDPQRIGDAGSWILVTDDDDRTRLISVEDGSEKSLNEDLLSEDTICDTDDHASVVVCAEEDGAVVVLDLDSGEVLWSDADFQGKVRGLWRGAVYVERGDSALALGARTGEVVVDDTGAAPAIVNDHVGLDQQGTDVRFYPAGE
ncbi:MULTISPECIES: PQQ-like beta-propeller repeat protein [Prauserella salsuginis group]|uniref:PQQ-like beta-propeller repeat protein n=1 Tax=Prauserella salsuginis TaxID=387889 RepID=A0ABW6GAU4_9PSEU|nr:MULTISPECIES: PQQ-like beta-propeller repeat protein [Prauserella salsuginis group]MCR3720613.1 PQQ-like domain-containing protein [Prauserella flava]MCR3735306.1 PQQ-like domain-containing protein [Prauserella salsuginis]